MKLQLQRTGQCLPLRLWVASRALTGTLALGVILPYSKRLEGIFLEPLPRLSVSGPTNRSVTFALQVKLADLQKWLGMPLPNLQYLHLGGLTVNGNPHTIQISLLNLEKLSFGMTVPRFFFPESRLRYLGFINSLVTMQKLFGYLSHCEETLEKLCLDGVTMTDVDAPGEGFPSLVMPHVTELIIQTPGGDGLAELLLTNIYYPELHFLTFGASPGTRFGPWHQPPSGGIHLQNLEVLDFDDGILSARAFQDVLEGAPNIRKLVMPRFNSEDSKAAVDALVAWGAREGKDTSRLVEVVATDLRPKDMIRIIEALPSIRTLDMSRALKKGKQAGDLEEWKWLKDRVYNPVGLFSYSYCFGRYAARSIF